MCIQESEGDYNTDQDSVEDDKDAAQDIEKNKECRPSAAKRAKLDEAEFCAPKCKLKFMLCKESGEGDYKHLY